MTLISIGSIVRSPENEDYATEKAAAGGTHDLGALPMGDGRVNFPGDAYTAPVMVYCTIPAPNRGDSFRWRRLLTRRSWNIRMNAGAGRWEVTQRSRRGFPDDDTGALAFNDATPSVALGRIYIYDNSALVPGNRGADAIGDYIREEKDFTYRVERRVGAIWETFCERHVGQIIVVKRKAITGVTVTDWDGVENSNAYRTVSATITEPEVRAMVGGAIPIHIDPGANH